MALWSPTARRIMGCCLVLCFWTGSVSTSVCAQASDPSATAVSEIALDPRVDGDSTRTSLEWLPMDTDLYMSAAHLKAQFQRVMGSHVMTLWQSSSLWKKVAMAGSAEWKDRKGEWKQVRAVLENPSVKDALRFAEEILSEDVFVFADSRLSRTLEQLQSIQSKLHLMADEGVSDDKKAEIVFEWIDRLLPEFQFPTLMVGARFQDAERALSKVDEVEGLLRFGLGSRPEFRDAMKRLERIEDRRGSRLRWSVNGTMIPWESIPTNEVLDAESLSDLRDGMQSKSFTITLGSIDEFFVLMLSGDPNAMDSFGAGERLLDHPHWKAIRDHVSQRVTGSGHPLTSVRFVSDALAKAQFVASLDGFFGKLARGFLYPAYRKLDPNSDLREWLTMLHDDGAWIDAEIGQHVPAWKGVTEWSYLTDEGWETWVEYRTQPVLIDSSTPLRGLSHVGVDPLVFLNLRLAPHAEYFESSRRIVRRIHERLEGWVEIDESELPAGDWQASVKRVLAVWPSIKQLADIWQEEFLPAMDGELVFALQTGGLMSNQWHPDLPVAREPLPAPEMATLFGLRDRARWMEGCRRLKAWVGRILQQTPMEEGARDAILGGLPRVIADTDLEVETFGIPIPEDCPAPKSMMPRMSVGADWANMNFSDLQDQAMRRTSLTQRGAFAFDASEPNASAAYIDLGGIARAMKPWLEYGLDQMPGGADDRLPLPENKSGRTLDITPRDLLEFWETLGALGEMASFSRVDGDGRWTSRAVFRSGESKASTPPR
jgi:hypothetical protein